MPGFEIAISTMRRKEEARFLLAPAYYLGERGCGLRVPPNSTGMICLAGFLNHKLTVYFSFFISIITEISIGYFVIINDTM